MSARDPTEVLAKAEEDSCAKVDQPTKRRRRLDDAVPPLCAWLHARAREYGHSKKQTAAAIGITTGYIDQLMNGHRLLSNVSERFVRGCARYLGVPPIVVKLAAGRITHADWDLVETDEDVSLERALARLHGHPRFKLIPRADIAGLSNEARRTLVAACGEAVGLNFFESKDIPLFLDALRVPALRIAAVVAVATAAADLNPKAT